jgi:hypothetical protein
MMGAVVGEHKVEIRTAPKEVDPESKEKIIERLPNATVIFCGRGLRLFFVLFFWLLCYLFLITDNTS